VVAGVVRQAPGPNAMTPPPSGKLFYGRDRAAMAQALGVTGAVSPYTVYATTSANPELTTLRPVSPPAAFSNNHLGYALTWFGLAITLVVFYAALLLRRYRPTPAKDR
uniref:SURF1 family cytochrome oxidase biogenesis protein n=1 Tax=Brevundimonas sp. TaxID=1871086 RepID=UPI0028AAEF49